MTSLLAGDNLVDILDVDEGVPEWSDMPGTHLNGFLLKKYFDEQPAWLTFFISMRVFQKVLTWLTLSMRVFWKGLMCLGPISMGFLVKN